MGVDILFPHEKEAREIFLKEYQNIREKFGLPNIEELEETLHLNFPTFRKSVNIKIEDALLFMLRTAYDQLAATLSQVLFPRDPIRAIECPFENEKEKREAQKVLLNLLLKYWEITKLLREGSFEEKINGFKNHFEEFPEFENYIRDIVNKTIEKLKKEIQKIKKEEEKIYFR